MHEHADSQEGRDTDRKRHREVEKQNGKDIIRQRHRLADT